MESAGQPRRCYPMEEVGDGGAKARVRIWAPMSSSLRGMVRNNDRFGGGGKGGSKAARQGMRSTTR